MSPIVSTPLTFSEEGKLGDIPEDFFKEYPDNDKLGKAMKEEVVMASASSCKPRQSDVLDLSSDDDEEDFVLSLASNNVISSDKSNRLGSRNEIYGYRYACKYLWSAHMGKNGPFLDEKIYNKESIII